MKGPYSTLRKGGKNRSRPPDSPDEQQEGSNITHHQALTALCSRASSTACWESVIVITVPSDTPLSPAILGHIAENKDKRQYFSISCAHKGSGPASWLSAAVWLIGHRFQVWAWLRLRNSSQFRLAFRSRTTVSWRLLEARSGLKLGAEFYCLKSAPEGRLDLGPTIEPPA